MRPYFEKMTAFGRALSDGQIKSSEENAESIKAVEADIEAEKEKIKHIGFPEEKINARGQMTVWQRLAYLVDPGTWCPLHSLYNPEDNLEGTTNVVDGLGRISGKWAVIIGFDNKLFAGAWIPGQADNVLRVTDLALRLNIPLVWLVNCSGVKLTEQEKILRGSSRRGCRVFPACRAGKRRNPDPGCHIRHQSGGRRLPRDQPDRFICPQEL